MRRIGPAAVALLAAALLATKAPAGDADTRPWLAVTLSSRSPAQGDPVLVEAIDVPFIEDAAVVWKGREYPMKGAGAGRFQGLVGVDLSEIPGKVPLSVRGSVGRGVLRFDTEIDVRERAFPVQEITVPERMARFDDAVLDRIRSEAARLDELFAALSPPAWELPFLPPVADFRPTGFGARRVVNGEPRSPHAGADAHLPEGTAVAAAAPGTVVFAGDQFFGGRSVVIDHGGGVFTVYYHLRDRVVAEGQRVGRGERIGAVGSTGRSTGPHLHFGIRAAGGRIDPGRVVGAAFR